MGTDRRAKRWAERQLPRGVPSGVWEYAQADHIAEDYDEYFALNRLFEFDEQILARYLTKPGRVIDLGCGTGRALMPLARRGFQCLGVDLSLRMLQIVGEKATLENLPIDRVCANMVELDCLADASFDYGLCLFSTLGMVHGVRNRRRVLAHAHRILKPGGLFILHVHNVWYNLWNPLGRRWLVRHLLARPCGRHADAGDKYFDYRGILNMYVHAFTRGELLEIVTTAGFRVRRLISLDAARQQPLRHGWFLSRLRANGWIAVCQNGKRTAERG